MEALLGPKNGPKFFDKNFGPNILPLINFHMVNISVQVNFFRVSVGCKTTAVLLTSHVEYWYSCGYLCETALHYVVAYCKP